jgi:hypothetical protein
LISGDSIHLSVNAEPQLDARSGYLSLMINIREYGHDKREEGRKEGNCPSIMTAYIQATYYP